MVNIIVCLKQSLDVSEIKIDKSTQKPILKGVSLKVSDFDKNAVEEAVRIKEKHGGKVTLITVGGEEGTKALKEGLSIGADEAFLINDPIFNNSDTLATSRILEKAINKINEYDLILFGEGSVDSYSGILPSRVAERLNLPEICYVRKIEIEDNKVTAERPLEDCTEIIEGNFPILLSVTNEINEPRIPSYMLIIKAKKKPMTVWTSSDLGIEKEQVGTDGSAIQVIDVLAPIIERKQIEIKGENVQEITDNLANAIIKEGVLER